MSKWKHTFRDDLYTFSCDEAIIVFDRIAAGKNGEIKTECEVRWNLEPKAGLVYHGSLNILAATSVVAFANHCEKRIPEYDWQAAFVKVTHKAKTRYREGDPPVPLITIDGSYQRRWLLPPILEYGGPTVVAAPGGSGKSFLALAALATVCTGRGKFLGINSKSKPASGLYLDWESDGPSHSNRLEALCVGADVEYPSNLFYRRESAPFAESAADLARYVTKAGVGMVVIDSKGAALGGAPEDAAEALKFFRAVRLLGIPALIVDHVTNEQAFSKKGAYRPFGSVYTQNLARNIWMVRLGEPEDGELSVSWKHTKSNNGPLRPDIAWRLGFDMRGDDLYESIRIKQVPSKNVQSIHPENETARAGLKRVMSVDEYVPLSTEAIRLLLPAFRSSVGTRLSEYDEFINVGTQGKARWDLAVRHESL